MKRFYPYIALLAVVTLAAAAVFHKIYNSGHRIVKYGNPAYERLIRECRYYKSDKDYITVKLYEGRNSVRQSIWYSVTYEQPGTAEAQIFISAGNPGIESIGLCDKEIKLMCGKGCINIPLDSLKERADVPLIYYNGRETEESGLSDKI